jgi:putative MFS transporter
MKRIKALTRKSPGSHLWQGSSFYQMMILTIVLGVAFAMRDQVSGFFILPMKHIERNLSYIQSLQMPTVVLPGICLGAVFWGTIADRIGRKRALMYTILPFTTTNLIQTHPCNDRQFTITCFFMGIGVGGEILIAFPLFSEFMPARMRTRLALTLGMLAIAPGYMCAAVSAHFLLSTASWTSLCYVQAIPALLVAVIRFPVPESPHDLCTGERDTEAQRVLAEIKHRSRSDDGCDTAENMVGCDRRHPPLWLRLLRDSLYRRRTRANWLFGFPIGFFQLAFPLNAQQQDQHRGRPKKEARAEHTTWDVVPTLAGDHHDVTALARKKAAFIGATTILDEQRRAHEQVIGT